MEDRVSIHFSVEDGIIEVEQKKGPLISRKEISRDQLLNCFRKSVYIREDAPPVLSSGFLPLNTLAVRQTKESVSVVVWYPRLRADLSLYKTPYPDFPIPRLVFGFSVGAADGAVSACRIGVIADETPTPDTIMYHYPFSNVDSSGSLCTLPLSGLFESAPEDGRVQHMELAVQILRDDGSGGGIDQYVRFCQISDEMRGRHGATLKAVQETLRECVRQNILAPFLLTREKEVSDIMISLFNQEEIQAIHDYNVAKQAQETALKQTVLLMRDLGVAREEAVRQLAKRYDLLQNDAETAVRQYWTI